MRLTFEAHTMEHIFDQMVQVLGEKIHPAPEQANKADIVALQMTVEDKDRELVSAADTIKRLEDKVRLRDLRITELEGHLAHAVGTRDLREALARSVEAVGDERVTKALDAAADAVMGRKKPYVAEGQISASGRKFAEAADKLTAAITRTLPDVDRAIKPPPGFKGALAPGVWRLTIPQFKAWQGNPDKGGPFRATEMPNGEWIVNTEGD